MAFAPRRHPDVLDFALVRGLYDLVFAYEDADPQRPSFGAGQAIFLTALALFQYKGAIFWKIAAGMGDIVIAPMYQALRKRGVEFGISFTVSTRCISTINAWRSTRSRWADESASLTDSLPPSRSGRGPRVAGVSQHSVGRPACRRPDTPTDGWRQSLETHWSDRADAETRVLRRGIDFDHVVLAVSVGMLPNSRRRDDRQSSLMAGYDSSRSHRRHSGVSNLASPRRTHLGMA